MKRITVAILIFLALVAGSVLALPLFLSSDVVRQNIIASLEDLTGRKVTFQGNPTVSFSPFLGIEISNLVVIDPDSGANDPPLMRVELMQAQLDVLPALGGQVSVSEYRLVRPELNLTVYEDGKENWKFERGAFRRALETTASGGNPAVQQTKLGEFAIENGKIHFEDRISGQTENVTSINSKFDWINMNAPVEVSGTAIWRGENISLDLRVDNFLPLAAGGNSKTQFSFTSAPVSFEFDGEANLIADLFLKGKTSISSPSLDRMAEFMRIEFGNMSALGAWTINGNLEGTIKSSRITEAITNIGGHRAQGAINLSIDELEQTKVDGTLAFDVIDLTSRLEQKETASEVMPDANNVHNIELDMRISANAIRAGTLELRNVAATIGAKEHNWIFDIGHSEGLGGTIISKIGERIEDEKQQAFLTFSTRDIDLAALPGFDKTHLLSIAGKANIDANLRTNSLRIDSLFNSLNGSLNAKLSNGTIKGMNLKALMAGASEKNSGQDVTELEPGGSTAFDEFSISGFLNNGIASIAQAKVISNAINVQLLGDVNFHDNGIALRAQETREDTPLGEWLFIGGTLENPLFSHSQTRSSSPANESQSPPPTAQPDVSN